MIFDMYHAWTRIITRAVMYPSDQCKTKGCCNHSWQDGYCKECAQYILQKETLLAFQEKNQIMADIADGLHRIESRLSKLKISKTHEKKMTDNSVVEKIEGEAFVPKIDVDQTASLINTKTATEKQKINEASKKLQLAQKQGVK